MKRLYLWILLILAAPALGQSEEPQVEAPDLEQLLIDIVATTDEGRVDELNKALLALPEQTDMFVRTAIEAGYPDPDVLAQCDMGVAPPQVPTLIDVLVENGTALAPIINRCLPRVPEGEMVNVVTNLLMQAEPAEMEDMIQITLAVLNDEGIDSNLVLVNSLVEGGLIEGDDLDCTGECLRPFAEELVSNIGEDFDLDLDTDIGDEPALSES